MSKEFAKAFYSSGKWLKCRASYIAERQAIDGGVCEECGEALGYIVHHKITLTETNIYNPDISLNFEHLQYVCKACHDKFDGHFKPKNKNDILPLIGFDDDGQPYPILPPVKKCCFVSLLTERLPWSNARDSLQDPLPKIVQKIFYFKTIYAAFQKVAFFYAKLVVF